MTCMQRCRRGKKKRPQAETRGPGPPVKQTQESVETMDVKRKSSQPENDHPTTRATPALQKLVIALFMTIHPWLRVRKYYSLAPINAINVPKNRYLSNILLIFNILQNLSDLKKHDFPA